MCKFNIRQSRFFLRHVVWTRTVWLKEVAKLLTGDLYWERHVAVVLTNVSLENVGAGTQDPLKPGPVQLDTLERTHSCDSGSAGSVQHQRNLTEIVWWSQNTHFLTSLSLVSKLCDGGIPVKSKMWLKYSCKK